MPIWLTMPAKPGRGHWVVVSLQTWILATERVVPTGALVPVSVRPSLQPFHSSALSVYRCRSWAWSVRTWSWEEWRIWMVQGANWNLLICRKEQRQKGWIWAGRLGDQIWKHWQRVTLEGRGQRLLGRLKLLLFTGWRRAHSSLEEPVLWYSWKEAQHHCSHLITIKMPPMLDASFRKKIFLSFGWGICLMGEICCQGLSVFLSINHPSLIYFDIGSHYVTQAVFKLKTLLTQALRTWVTGMLHHTILGLLHLMKIN